MDERILFLPTSVVLSLVVAAGVAFGTIVIWREPKLPSAARWIAAVLGAYGVIAFLHGAWTRAPFPALLAGQSLWRGLPYVLQGAVIGGLLILPAALVISAVRAGLRPPAAGSRARAIRQAAALATALAIVLAALPLRERPAVSSSQSATSASAAAGGFVPSPERLAALENSFRAIEDGERESPRDRWDPEYVVEQLGRDPQVLFEWVRDNTYWIPYRGVLRGPTGVLMDRLGNSLDRSMLLASLLQKAGHNVRLARGQLPRELGHQMLRDQVARRAESVVDPVSLGSEAELELERVAAQYQLDPADSARTFRTQARETERVLAKLDARVSDQTSRLLLMVGRPEAGADWTNRLDAAIEALRDHWWLQRQAGDRWVDLDVLHSQAGAGHALAAARETLELHSIEAEYYEVAIRVVAEQQSPHGVLERVVVDHSLRPAAIIGKPVAIRFWPVDWPVDFPPADLDPKEAFKSTALDQHSWAASIVVGRDIVAKATLHETGDVEPLAVPGPMAGLGGRLTEALERRGERPPAPRAEALTAVWIEYEIRSPGQVPRRIRRVVFDLLGPDVRAARPTRVVIDAANRLTRNLSLMRETQILPVVSRFAPEFLSHLITESLLANRDVLRSAVRGEVTEASAQTAEFRQRVSAMPSPLYSLALARLEWGRSAKQTYVDRPAILTRHMFPASEADKLVLVDATDIVANEVGVDLTERDAFAVRLEQGVLDTNAESLLQPSTAIVSNTAEAFATSEGWITLTGSDDARLQALGLPGDARRQIVADINAGSVVIVPGSPVRVGSEDFIGWWRIDRVTGHTLGIDRNGWGNSMVKYAFLISVLEGFVIGWTFEFLMCKGAFQPPPGNLGPASNTARARLFDYVETPVAAAEQDSCWRDALLGGVAGSIFAMLGRVLFGRFMRVPEFLRRLKSGGGGKPAGFGGPPGGQPPSPPTPRPSPSTGGGPGRGSGGGRGSCEPRVDPLGKTDPQLGGPPTKISPQSEPPPPEAPPRNPNDIKAPRNPNPGGNPELQKLRYEDLHRQHGQAFKDYLAASNEARAAEAEWWQAREIARRNGTPDPPMPDAVKRTTTNAENKARVEDDLRRAMEAAKKAWDRATANAVKESEAAGRAGFQRGDTLPSGEPPTPVQGPVQQGPIVSPCGADPNSAGTIPGHQTLVGINGVQNTLAGAK